MSPPCNVESYEKNKIEQVSHAIEFKIWCPCTEQKMRNQLDQHGTGINDAHDLQHSVNMTVSEALFLFL